MQDDLCKHNPYSLSAGRFPKYIWWDRYNYGLKTHFYSHRNILNIKEGADKRFAIFTEGEEIIPDDYKLFKRNGSLNREFNKIFTYSEKILDKYENALFCPSTGISYGTSSEGGAIDENRYLYKTKNISMISSNKIMTELYKFRVDLCNRFKYDNRVDTYGTFDGGKRVEKISEVLDDYRYSVIIENGMHPYYFTEKY